jgi:hypothetical protein
VHAYTPSSLSNIVYDEACAIVCNVAIRPICLWNKLNVENCHPVAHMKILFLAPKSQRIGKFDIAKYAQRSATYRPTWVETSGQLRVVSNRNIWCLVKQERRRLTRGCLGTFDS